MALQNKRSDTPRARANLIPGELAHQRADGLLLIRGDGNRKIEVDLTRWLSDAAPEEGLIGAPLRRTAEGVEWAAELAPSSEVNGVVAVDAPLGVYGVPGLVLTDMRPDLDAVSDRVLIENIYVSSDRITVTELAFRVISGAGAAARIGIVSSSGSILFETRFDVTIGKNTAACDVELGFGVHQLMLWIGAPITLAVSGGVRADQGMDFADRTPQFVRRRNASAPLGTALYYQGLPLTDDLSALPGEDHTILVRWALAT